MNIFFSRNSSPVENEDHTRDIDGARNEAAIEGEEIRDEVPVKGDWEKPGTATSHIRKLKGFCARRRRKRGATGAPLFSLSHWVNPTYS